MAESAARTIVLASPGKVGLAARARVVGWERVDALVSASLPPEFARGVAQRGVEVAEVT
jgi:DeoR/GlpR family transcriptional regulator of sugar metabolism